MKTCAVCESEFEPFTTTQKVCSTPCAIELINLKKEQKAQREWNKEKKVRKDALKSKSDWLNDLQVVVNKYVRLRDSGKPCCSCDKPDDGTHQRHASHYRSVGACSALRFNLKNIHASCQQCNTAKSGNLLEFRIRLVAKHGVEYVEWLESQNQVVRYDLDYINRFKRIFNKKAKLKQLRG